MRYFACNESTEDEANEMRTMKKPRLEELKEGEMLLRRLRRLCKGAVECDYLSLPSVLSLGTLIT